MELTPENQPFDIGKFDIGVRGLKQVDLYLYTGEKVEFTRFSLGRVRVVYIYSIDWKTRDIFRAPTEIHMN